MKGARWCAGPKPKGDHLALRWREHLVMRGLEQETGSGLEQLRRMCDAMAQQLEQVQEVMEVLETREAERFRRFLGHLQHHQVLTTELVCGQRVKMAGDRPGLPEDDRDGARSGR